MAVLSQSLPAQLTSFVGRDQDLAAVAALVQGPGRLVTVTGVGGCGKTRLALALGSELSMSFPDGVWFVPLDSLTDERLIVPAIAAALDLPEVGGRTARDAVIGHLLARTTLLILDNCEHVIEEGARVALELLLTCPELRILATSREPLQISGERRYGLEPLRSPGSAGLAPSDELMAFPAIQLFVERAQAVVPDFLLTPDTAADIAAVCDRLDGIPLAIELAAARVNSLSVAEILDRLADCFRLLSGVNRGRPTRQQTMRGAMDWSYDLLSAEERVLFRQLATFAGGFDMEAVEGLVPPGMLARSAGDGVLPQEQDVVSLLAQLVDKSLVVAVPGVRTMRYRLLEPVRQYAGHLLAMENEETDARLRHAGFILRMAERAGGELSGARQIEWLDRLEENEGNLRLALQWFTECGDTDAALRLATALHPFWIARDRLAEGRRWLESGLAACAQDGAVDPGLRVRALRSAGLLAYLQYDFSAAEALQQQGLIEARAMEDRQGIAAALSELSLIAAFQADHERAAALSDESVILARGLSDPATLAFALLSQGNAAQERADVEAARPVLEESLHLFQTIGDDRHIAIANTLLGSVALKAADPVTATEHLREALVRHHRIGNRWFIIYDMLLLATALAALDAPHRAARILGVAEGLAAALGEVYSPIGGSAAQALTRVLRQRLGDAQLDVARAEAKAFAAREEAVEDALDALHALASRVSVAPVRAARNRGLPLTRRQLEVAQLIARGYTDRKIAEELFITTGTVGVHVHQILRNLSLQSRWQVAAALEARARSATDVHE